MAERVRRFRVVNAFHVCNVDAGDIGEYRGQSGAGLMLFYNPKWSSGRPDNCVPMYPYDVEELPAFAVGDAVRVKAGITATTYRGVAYVGSQGTAGIGRKLIIGYMGVEGNQCDVRTVDGYDAVPSIDVFCLEPWNDAEEWDGSKWVAKKPVDSSPRPAIVCLREDGKLISCGRLDAYDSTNAAFASAQRQAEAHPGKEYVVLQEKGSKRVEPKRPVEVVAEDMRQAIGKEDDFCANQVDFTGIRETVEIEGDCVWTRVRVISLN